ncbi:MAG: hypothetical protein ACI8RN_002382, partial [Glaciecola sp.]
CRHAQYGVSNVNFAAEHAIRSRLEIVHRTGI